MRLRTRQPRDPRRAVVLLAVLLVVVLLTLAAYQYSELMLAEYKAAESVTRAARARVLADSGVHFAAAVLSDPDAFANLLAGNPYDNASAFHARLVQDDGRARLRGYFSALAPNDDGTSYRFGVSDETGKINVNALAKLDSSGDLLHDILIKLPNMTEEVADAVIDWIDADDTQRPSGAENEYYSALGAGFRCKNAPLDSVEELLLVRGVTPELLFGNDYNRNGLLDADEGDGPLDRGWSASLTIFSRERNVDAAGAPRVYVNDADLQTLATTLTEAVGEDVANFILAYRLYGSSSSQGGGQDGGQGGGQSGGSGQQGGGASGSGQRLSRDSLNLQGGGQARSISSLYEVVNAQVTIPSSDPRSPSVVYDSPLKDSGVLRDALPKMLDKLTTVRDAEVPGRVNINTATEAVLLTLPGLTEDNVQTILETRPPLASSEAPDPIYQTPAWLLTEANLSADTLRALERYVTASTQVYRVQVLGYFEGGGPTARVEAVIDTNGGRPRVLAWRDLTELGKGYELTIDY